MSKKPAKQREAIGKKPFSVSARVAMQLGRESISSSIVAILELVKNAYDADAENVYIRFVGLEGFEQPSLIIQDDGVGMTKSQVEDNWLVIGTSNKALLRLSSHKKRILVGEKGLGRLGLDRLAHKTRMLTFSTEADFGIELEIDWQKYENAANERLESIEHDLFKVPKEVIDPKNEDLVVIEQGTRLELVGLKDKWTKKDLEKLREELTLLVSPFGGTNDFSIRFFTGVGDWQDLDGQIESSHLTEVAAWVLTSSLTESGHIHYEVHSYDGVEFKTDEEWADLFRGRDIETKPRCGPIEFIMYFYERLSPIWDARASRFLESNQGIRIYRDNFRVKPYGDPSGEGDWLNLAMRRVRNPAGVGALDKRWVVGYNQVVGAVFIERKKNEALLDQTNREGIVEGPAYFDLRRYVLSAVEFFEEQRQKYERSQQKRKKIEEAREDAQTKSQAVIGATSKVKDSWEQIIEKIEQSATTGETPDFDQIRQTFDTTFLELERSAEESAQKSEELARESEEQEEEYEEQKNTLGNLASLGIITAAFGHETVGYAKEVVGNVKLLRDDIYPLFPPLYEKKHLDIIKDIDDIERAANRINTFAAFALGNVQRDKRKRKDESLESIARDVFKAVNLGEIYKIETEIDFASDIPKISIFRIDWESIFINLITNAKWAIDNSPDINRPRKIRVRAIRDDSMVHLFFSDSGCGIPKYAESRIFEPGFSTKENRQGDIIGTGMGLAIVENFIEAYNGKIDVKREGDLGGAEFHIEIPLISTKRRK